MFAIRADQPFDGEDFRAGGATVLVEDGRIVGVESAAYELPSECELVDHGNATVLTGLIETHFHLVGDSGAMALERVPGNSPEQIKAVVTEALRRQLAAGVTTSATSATQRQVDDSPRPRRRSGRLTTGCPGSLPPVHRSPSGAGIAASSGVR